MSVAVLPRPHEDGGHRRKWTVEEFTRASNLGLFRPDERLELIQGEIYEKMPPNPPHASLTDSIAESLRPTATIAHACVRVEKPLVLSNIGQPEPDIAVVRGVLRDYLRQHPTASDALLVIEVSDSTLEQDRTTKRDDYAAAGIPEYWIVNINQRQIEVFRDPQDGRWQETFTVAETDTLAALFAPLEIFRAAEFLP